MMKIEVKKKLGGKKIQIGDIEFGQVFQAKLEEAYEVPGFYIIATDDTAVGSRLVLLEIDPATGFFDRVVVADTMEYVYDYEPLESTLTIGE